MIQKVFAVRDSKAQAFMQPFFSAQSGSAIRAFEDVVNEKGSVFAKHPSDYVLYELGSFDDNSGEFISLVPIRMLNTGADVLKYESLPRRVVTEAEAMGVLDSVQEAVSNGK